MNHQTVGSLFKAVILAAGMLAVLLFAPLSRAAAVDAGALGRILGNDAEGYLHSLTDEMNAIQDLYRLAVDFDARLRETLKNYPLTISYDSSGYSKITDVLQHLEGLSSVLLRGVEAYRDNAFGLQIGDPTFSDLSLPGGLFGGIHDTNQAIATVSLPPAYLLFGTALVGVLTIRRSSPRTRHSD